MVRRGLTLLAAAVLPIGGCAAIAGIDAPVDRADRDASGSDAPGPDGLVEEGDEGPTDASFAEASDSSTEAATCTPFTTGFTYGCHNQKDNLVVPEPSQYCFASGPDVNTANLTQVVTPPACQCQETFTCTCITAHSPSFPCASPTCNEGVIGGMPVLVLGCP